ARTDHRAHDQHGGAGEAQTLHQFLVLMTVDVPVAARRRLRCRGAQEFLLRSVASDCRAGVPPAVARATALAPDPRKRSTDFTSRCGKIPLLICAVPATGPIRPPRSRPRPR